MDQSLIVATRDPVSGGIARIESGVEHGTASHSASALPSLLPTASQGIKTMIDSTQNLVAFNKDTLEAFTKSGQIWAAGVQALTRQVAATAKASLDESLAAFKALGTVKSVQEAIALQNTLVRTAFEKTVAGSNEITGASIRLTNEALAPLAAHATAAAGTFGKTA